MSAGDCLDCLKWYVRTHPLGRASSLGKKILDSTCIERVLRMRRHSQIYPLSALDWGDDATNCLKLFALWQPYNDVTWNDELINLFCLGSALMKVFYHTNKNETRAVERTLNICNIHDTILKATVNTHRHFTHLSIPLAFSLSLSLYIYVYNVIIYRC